MSYFLSKNSTAYWDKLEEQARAVSYLCPSTEAPKTSRNAEVLTSEDIEKINEEINRVDEEICRLRGENPDQFAGSHSYKEFIQDPLISLLLRKKVHLKHLKLKVDEIVNEEPLNSLSYEIELFDSFEYEARKQTIKEAQAKEVEERKSKARVIFNVGKKIVDILDDAWNAARSKLSPGSYSPVVTGVFTGCISFCIFIGEGYLAITEAWATYQANKDSDKREWKKVVAGGVVFFIAGAGAGLGLSLFASTVGAAGIVGATFFPAILPALLGVIYTTILFKRIHIYNQAKIVFEEVEKDYKQHLAAFEKFRDNRKDDPNYKKKLKRLESKLLLLEQSRDIAKEKAFFAKKQAQFTAVEIACIAFTIVGSALSVVAAIGASVASFGSLPLAFIIMGVITGMTLKYFEHREESTHYQYLPTKLAWVKEKWDLVKKIFSSSKNPKKTPELYKPTMVAMPSPDRLLGATIQVNNPKQRSASKAIVSATKKPADNSRPRSKCFSFFVSRCSREVSDSAKMDIKLTTEKRGSSLTT